VTRENWNELLEEPAHTVPPARLAAAVVEKQVSLVALRNKSADRAKASQRGCDPQCGRRIRRNTDCRTECHTSTFARRSGFKSWRDKRKRTYPVEDCNLLREVALAVELAAVLKEPVDADLLE